MKKTKKIKKGPILALIGILALGIGTSVYFVSRPSHNEEEKNIQYSKGAIFVMKELNMYQEISNLDYSKTVEKMLEEKKFQEKHLKSYLEITYKEKKDFSTLVNNFLDKNYTSLEINNIFEYLNEKNITKLTSLDYTNLGDYFKVSNMEVDKISRYNNYKEEKKLDIQTAVTRVNVGLDLEFYEEVITIPNPDSVTLLINKYRALPNDWEPKDLVSLSTSSNYKMRKEAAEHFESMIAGALLDNVKILPYSPYRGKDRQVILYNNYVTRDGKKAADTYSARPRHSEHETGLTVDVRSPELNDNLNKNAYAWVKENAYKYGYIVRYPEDSTFITGYIPEPWHLRYIGIEAATAMHGKNITFDEYYDLNLKDKE